MKVWVVKKKTLILDALIAALAICVIIASVNVAPKIVSASASSRLLPIYNVERQDKIASLSFDAAWGNEDTQTLIDILKKYHVNATFFVVGGWVDKYPDSVKALSQAGNEVMNHSNTHPHMPSLTASKMADEISACDTKIEKVTGKKPTLFRPPYGDYNNTLIETLKDTGHYAIQWNVDSLDWKGITADVIKHNVLTKVTPGSIILFHNAAAHTPEALPGIIESLQKQGYKLVPVSQLIYKDNYTIDRAGMQHSAASPNENSGNASSGASSGASSRAASGASSGVSSSRKA